MDQNFYNHTFDNLLIEDDSADRQQGFDILSTEHPFTLDREDKEQIYPNFLTSNFNNEYDSEDFMDPVRKEISCSQSQSGQSRYSGYSTISSDENSKSTKAVEKKKRAIKREIAKSRKISKVESENKDSMDIDPKEKKKVQQMLKNRISAQASRDRKKMYITNLESKNSQLLVLNAQYEERIRRLEEENRQLNTRVMDCTCNSQNSLSSPTFLKFGLSIFTLVSVFLLVGIKNQENSRMFKSEGPLPSKEVSEMLKLPLPEMKAIGYSPNFDTIPETIKESRQFIESTLPMEIVPQTNAIVPVKNGGRKIVRAGKRKEKPEKSLLTTILCPSSYYTQDNTIMKKLKMESTEQEEYFSLTLP